MAGPGVPTVNNNAVEDILQTEHLLVWSQVASLMAARTLTHSFNNPDGLCLLRGTS
jgi:hypothetical protein